MTTPALYIFHVPYFKEEQGNKGNPDWTKEEVT